MPRRPVSDPRRGLPAVDRLAGAVRAQDPGVPAWAAAAGARAVLAQARGAASSGSPPSLETLAEGALARARALARVRPSRVVNATGVVLHTHLGRAPLAAGAAEAARDAAGGYADLEIDLATGRRGDRLAGVADRLALLAGAEASLAVNNNAGALVLAVAALARGREVVISRGELIEIGGSFRLSEIVEAAGARLVEVGTTNRTHAEDYRRAIGSATALLLKVHRSNFEQRGFVAEVDVATLAGIARQHGLLLVEDLGSATLVDLRGLGLPEESYAPARLALGADLVCFSGDKLFGGPQAGLVIGRAAPITAMRAHPLARALRLDKMSLAALDWTLRVLLDGTPERLPAVRALLEPVAAVERRARALAARIEACAGDAQAGLQVAVAASRAPVGGGSLPGFELDSWVVALRPGAGTGAQAFADRLRAAPLPVIARVADGAVLLDTRTLDDDDETAVANAVAAALAADATGIGPR
jgi:L-seryl-tRNA(Ser) seleniumtransferase